MSSRDAFLARVQQAAEQGRMYRVHVRPQPEGVGYLGASGDLCARFAEEVNAVGGQAFVVGDLDGARQQLQQLLAEAGAKSAVCWRHELLERMGVDDLLASAGVERYEHDRLSALPVEERRRVVLACDIGITSCDWAIAETGTLVMCARPGRERVASLLPPLHVALVERRQIVPDLIDAMARLDPEALPSNVTFITGPSKTGDIELQLTTGVHGPGKWRVIVVA